VLKKQQISIDPKMKICSVERLYGESDGLKKPIS
jgi:hypothetical protein